jgi:hypothetical protein
MNDFTVPPPKPEGTSWPYVMIYLGLFLAGAAAIYALTQL